MIVGYAIPAVQKFQGAAYKSLYYQALENSKADGATPDDNPCLIARGDELYRAGAGAVPSVLIVPQFVKPGAVYTQIPTPTVEAGDFDQFTFTRATTATRVNASGLIESVASGLLRLDYPVTGGCPAALIEPAATNLFARSNELNIGAPWTQDNIVFTTGSTSAFTSPDGTTNAFLMADTSGNTRHRISQQPTTSFVSGTTYTASIFVKKNSSSRFLLINGNTAFGAMAALNLDTLAITNINGSGASIDNYGNGWYRFSIRGTATSTQATSIFIQMQNNATDSPYIGDGSSFYLYGAQLETGAIPTSYIPTTTASATRNADVCSVTGVSGYIGQTEGTLYAEVDLRNINTGAFRRIIDVTDGTSGNRLQIQTNNTDSKIRISIFTAGSEVWVFTSSLTYTGITKIALAYKNNDTAYYVNGSLVSGTTSITVPATNRIQLGSTYDGASFLNDRIRAAAIYTTRLSNDQLASLTRLT